MAGGKRYRDCGPAAASFRQQVYARGDHALITVRLEPIPPFDDAGVPSAWRVVDSKGKQHGVYPGAAKTVAQAYVTEFNITAYELVGQVRNWGSQSSDRADE